MTELSHVEFHTLFCSLKILDHFFSNRVSYFFVVAGSKTSSPKFSSALIAETLFERLFAER